MSKSIIGCMNEITRYMDSRVGDIAICIEPSDKAFLMRGTIIYEYIGMNNTLIAEIRFGENFSVAFGWHMFCLEPDYDEACKGQQKILVWDDEYYHCEVVADIKDRKCFLLKFPEKKLYFGSRYSCTSYSLEDGNFAETVESAIALIEYRKKERIKKQIKRLLADL